MDIRRCSEWLYYAKTMDGWADVGDFSKSDVIAIMASGWTAPAGSLNDLRIRLWEQQGIPSRMGATFRPNIKKLNILPYESYRRLGVKLASRFEKTALEYPDKKFIGIGQSLGGNGLLAAYQLLLGKPGICDRIIGIFPLGSPFYGVQIPVLKIYNPMFVKETKKVFEKSAAVKKIVAIHAKYDEIVPIWHSRLRGAEHEYVDTGFDTFPDKLFALFYPLPAFLLSFVPVRHISLAFSPQVPEIIAKYTYARL